jgi:hypothetical protein
MDRREWIVLAPKGPGELGHLTRWTPAGVRLEVHETVDDPGRYSAPQQPGLEQDVPPLSEREPVAALPKPILEIDEGLDLTERPREESARAGEADPGPCDGGTIHVDIEGADQELLVHSNLGDARADGYGNECEELVREADSYGIFR